MVCDCGTPWIFLLLFYVDNEAGLEGRNCLTMLLLLEKFFLVLDIEDCD